MAHESSSEAPAMHREPELLEEVRQEMTEQRLMIQQQEALLQEQVALVQQVRDHNLLMNVQIARCTANIGHLSGTIRIQQRTIRLLQERNSLQASVLFRILLVCHQMMAADRNTE